MKKVSEIRRIIFLGENGVFTAEYIYQIYAYLRSQEGDKDPMALGASGLLLHPSIDKMIDETVLIQGHAIRFASVNLGGLPERSEHS